jgi:two-component system sensor histidine kinase/response regulator
MSQMDPLLLPLLKNSLYAITDRIIFLTDNSGNIRFCNAAAQKHLGVDFQQFATDFNVTIFHLKEELETHAKSLKKILGHPIQANFEAISANAKCHNETDIQNWMYRCLDGSTFPVELMVTAAHNDEGDLEGFLIVARDITEVIANEEALKDSEEWYRSVVNVMEEGIILQDADGTIIACNASAEKMLGQSLEQMNDPFASTKLWDAVDTNGLPFPTDEYPITISFHTGQPCSKVVMGLRDSNGTMTWLSVNSRPLFRTNALKPHAVMISLSDITERRQTEIQLARAHDVAVNAAQLKSSFLANASHEIRTPLNGVIGIVDILLDTDLSERQRAYVKTLDNSAESLLSLINDLLDLSKIEAGKDIVEEDIIDVTAIARSATESLSIQAQTKGIGIDAIVIPPVPPQLCGDGKRLRQILSNLLFNALKFTESGEILLRVMLHEETEFSTTICFEVIDTGIGISPEATKHIFEPFWQSHDNTKPRYASTGLGLAISKQLVELMGGRIWVESILGRGSNFCFTLPLRKTQDVLEPATNDFTEHETSTSFLEKIDPAEMKKRYAGVRVLLVEDNEVNQQVVLYQLQEWGCITDVAVDGVEALDRIEHQLYDLVLMDCMLPNVDGYEATGLIRRREKALQEKEPEKDIQPLYIVALTANAMLGDREKCFAVGMNDYISKPLRLPTLRAAFERWEKRNKIQLNSDSKHTLQNEGTPDAALDTEIPKDEAPLWRASDINNSIIDVSVLINLRGPVNDDSLLLELIELFLMDSINQLHSIHLAFSQADLSSLLRHAHTLGGSCSHFGAFNLREICVHIEELCRVKDLSSARDLLPELDKSYEDVCTQLKELRDTLKARKKA